MQTPLSNSLAREASLLARTITTIAATVAALVAFGLPAGYFAVSYNFEKIELESDVISTAQALSNYVYGHEGLWRYESHRLEDVISEQRHVRDVLIRVLDDKGVEIIAVGHAQTYPVLTASSEIRDVQSVVGRLVYTESLVPVLLRSALVGLIGLVLAALIMVSVRLLPLRALRLTFGRLEASQAELRLANDALNQTGNCIFITDDQGRTLYANQAFEQATGVSREDALNRDFADFFGLAEDKQRKDEVWDSISQGRVWRGRHKVSRKDGTSFDSESSVSPLLDDAGEITNYLFVYIDITRQVILEDQARHDQRMSSLGTLAGGIAHDINNILVPIMGGAQMLMSRMEGEEGKIAEMPQVILKAAVRARDLVSQILLFARKHEVKIQAHHLRPIMEEAARLLASTLPASVNIRREYSQQSDLVFGDNTLIHQVLMNLCINAGQAMPDGGELTISLKNAGLDGETSIFGETIDGQFAVISVEDTGHGMDEQTRLHVFDPFFTTKDVGEGTGMGLAAVYGIVADMKGHLTVSSRPGHGSKFEVFLSVAPEEKPAVVHPEVNVLEENYSVLLVDDEVTVIEITQALLEEMGHRVDATTDPEEAVKLFAARPAAYDIVITDYTMPNMKGSELAQRIREFSSAVPIVLCTGYSDSMDAGLAKDLGIDLFIYKPIEREQLMRIISEVILAKGVN